MTNAKSTSGGSPGEFVGVVSHELRTPLAAVLGMLELLAEVPDVPEHALELVGAATRNAHKLLAILNDLLDVWAVDAGQLALAIDRIDVVPILDEVAADVAPRAASKGLRLDLTIPQRLPCVAADPQRLRQIVRHLLDNAIKFTDAGDVLVRAEQEDGRVRLIVLDTGIGIHPDDHERIFDAFVQADASATRRHGGAGLGLAICHRLATLMRATMGVRSTPGAGSAFWLDLPRAADG